MSKENEAWSNHAKLYEHGFERISIGFAQNAFTLANLVSPQDQPLKLLDIACGPGRFAVYAAQLGFQVTAIDVADKMVEFAKNRATAAGVSLTANVIDGQTLDGLEDASFDVVTSHFGMTLFPNRDMAFASALRVLKPGGRLILSSWGMDGFPIAHVIYPSIHAESKVEVSSNQEPSPSPAPAPSPSPSTMNHPGGKFDERGQDKITSLQAVQHEIDARGFCETRMFTLRQDGCFETGRECVETLLDNVMSALAFEDKNMQSVKICMTHQLALLNQGVNPLVDRTAPAPPKLQDGVSAENMPVWNEPVIVPSSAMIAISTKPLA